MIKINEPIKFFLYPPFLNPVEIAIMIIFVTTEKILLPQPSSQKNKSLNHKRKKKKRKKTISAAGTLRCTISARLHQLSHSFSFFLPLLSSLNSTFLREPRGGPLSAYLNACVARFLAFWPVLSLPPYFSFFFSFLF